VRVINERHFITVNLQALNGNDEDYVDAIQYNMNSPDEPDTDAHTGNNPGRPDQDSLVAEVERLTIENDAYKNHVTQLQFDVDRLHQVGLRA